MKVISFGDSYTFGYELSDCPTNVEPNHSHLTYSALVAKHLGYDYKCLAMGYYANNAICRTIIENILEARRVRKTISNNLTAIPDFDGKMRTTYFVCLDTARTSTGQQEPPIRPIQEVIEIDDNGKKHKKKKNR